MTATTKLFHAETISVGTASGSQVITPALELRGDPVYPNEITLCWRGDPGPDARCWYVINYDRTVTVLWAGSNTGIKLRVCVFRHHSLQDPNVVPTETLPPGMFIAVGFEMDEETDGVIPGEGTAPEGVGTLTFDLTDPGDSDLEAGFTAQVLHVPSEEGAVHGTLPDALKAYLNGASWTWEGWVKIAPYEGDVVSVGFGFGADVESEAMGIQLDLEDDHIMSYFFYQSGADDWIFADGVELTPGVYHHIAVVFELGETDCSGAFYVDGALADTWTGEAQPYTTVPGSQMLFPLFVRDAAGGDPIADVQPNVWVDDVRIYIGTKDAAEIQADYDRGLRQRTV